MSACGSKPGPGASAITPALRIVQAIDRDRRIPRRSYRPAIATVGSPFVADAGAARSRRARLQALIGGCMFVAGGWREAFRCSSQTAVGAHLASARSRRFAAGGMLSRANPRAHNFALLRTFVHP
jgi:hypothetical protein